MSQARIRNIVRRVSGGFAATALIGVPILSAQAQVVGVNSAVRNKVAIRAGGTAPPRPAVVRQKVALRDAVQTEEASNLQMLLLDGSVFTIGPRTRLTIDRFVYDPNRNAKTFGASVTRGAFRFMSGRPIVGGTSTVSTPIATIGIRGTIFDGVIGPEAIRIAKREGVIGPAVTTDPDTASLIVLRGPGAKTQGATHPGAIDVTAGGHMTALTQPGLAVFVPRPGATPIGPFQISGPSMMSLFGLIFPVSSLATAGTLVTGTEADHVGGETANGPNAPAGPAGSARALSVSRTDSHGLWLVAGGGVATLIAILAASGDNNPKSP